MTAENEQSALPPLDPNNSPESPALESPNETITSDNSPQEIKRNILQIYPRLQSLEKYINEIQQQLPSELNKNLLQIRRDIFNLKEKSGNQTTDINDVISQLKNLENQMNYKVDLCLDDFSSTLKEKYNVSKYKPKALVSQPPTNLQNEYDKNLDEILNSFNMNNKSTEQQLSNLEQKITKLTSQSTYFKPQNDIEQMRKSIQQQNIQLSELNINLNSLLQNSQQVSNSNISTLNRPFTILVENDPPQSLPEDEIPDLAEPIQLLSEQIQKFKNEFKNSLDEAYQKTQNCKNRLLSIKEMANEIQESATEIESKVIEVNNFCDSLSAQIKEISQDLSQKTAQRTIESISVQIKTAQDSIISELNSIKKRIKKCEMAEPLIVTNLSNRKNKDSNNDGDSNFPIVTFGKVK